ncbi:dTDP-4-dehydrorhamnose 3,5-epimerase family protein, partial [Seonamhaeicola marinus]
MQVEETYLKGCFVITPKVFGDDRGYFYESFNAKKFEELTGLSVNFVQDNLSKSSKGVLRGLHFQTGVFAQAKLVKVVKGKVLDVCVDLRTESETFGKHFSIVLDAEKHQQLFV